MKELMLVVDSLTPELIAPEGRPLAETKPTMPAADELKERLLRWEHKYVQGHALATVKAVRADWGIITTWCERARRCALPMSEPDLVLFLTDMLSLRRKRSTLERYLRTVALIHGAAALPSPMQDPEWKSDWPIISRRLADRNQVARKQAAPLRTDAVKAILATLGTSPLDLRDAALITLAADTLCRESELIQLQLQDITRSDETGKVTVFLGRTKTDQDGVGSYRFCGTEAWARIEAWCSCAGIKRPDDYLFIPVGRRKQLDPSAQPKPLTPSQVARIMARRGAAAGLAARLSGHSGRVGSAVELAESGFSVDQIMHAGGWRDERTVREYTKQARAGNNAMEQLREKQHGR